MHLHLKVKSPMQAGEEKLSPPHLTLNIHVSKKEKQRERNKNNQIMYLLILYLHLFLLSFIKAALNSNHRYNRKSEMLFHIEVRVQIMQCLRKKIKTRKDNIKSCIGSCSLAMSRELLMEMLNCYHSTGGLKVSIGSHNL